MTSEGFVVNDQHVRGGIYVLPSLVLTWTPKTFEEITKDSLCLTGLLNPPLEILVIGCGPTLRHNLDPALRQSLRQQGVAVEVLDTMNACATFNILNSEERQVAAAILPINLT